MKKLVLVASLLLLSVAAFAQNLAFQGFETDTGDWTPVTTRVPSGGGVLGVPSAAGNFHGELTNLYDTYSAGYGGAEFSFFGFASQPPYPGDFSQSISMYIFANWPLASPNNNGQGVWIDMSPGQPSGNFGGEHNFRLVPTGTTVNILVDGQSSPMATIAATGWYKFQMTYQKGAHPTDLVTTNMNVFDPNGNLIGTTTVVSNSPGGPLLSQDLAGPNYVWITVWADGWPAAGPDDVLAIDDVRADLLPTGPSYFVSYFSNANTANAPDATVRIVHEGDTGANLWADIYVFDDSEELTECCACMVTPDGLLSESVNRNLTANPLTGIKPPRGVIKVISSSSSDPTAIAPTGGLRVWGTHIQKATSGFAVTETPFANSNLAASEQTLLDQLCYYDALLSGKRCSCTPEDQDF